LTPLSANRHIDLSRWAQCWQFVVERSDGGTGTLARAKPAHVCAFVPQQFR
jgi:hypothetical protein